MLEASFGKKLWHFDLRVRLKVDSQIVVLQGPSGAGKTTALHCLAGLLQPSYGSIELDGTTLYSSLKGINIPARRRGVGYLFQDYALFPHMTVGQNVMYGFKSQKAGTANGRLKPLTYWMPSVSDTWFTGIPGSSPAGKSSGWPWSGRWPHSRSCSSWMNL